MKTTTLFFDNQKEYWAYADFIGSHENFRILDFGRTKRGRFYIKYIRKEA